jgi:DNA-binding XRE family transcriptional regulator
MESISPPQSRYDRGRILRQSRSWSGLNQRDFGKLIGVGENVVKLWEVGGRVISEDALEHAVHEVAMLLAMRSNTLLNVIQKPALTAAE